MPVSRRAILWGVFIGSTSAGSGLAAEPESRKQNSPSSQIEHRNRAVEGAAQWLQQFVFVASSMETGRVGYLEAWGGDEFGYAYAYGLLGEPQGVSVDSDTGILSIAAPLPAGAHHFQTVVANRKTPAKIARFPITLVVREGVTKDHSGDQILHKTYVVDSGLYGRPQDGDYTKVFMNLRTAIIDDQTAVGDGNLRATILLRRGQTYDYTDNRWPAGIQYLTVEPEPGVNPQGTRPHLRNVKPTFVFDSEIAILICGGGSAFNVFHDEIKRRSPEIYTVKPGADMVRLKNKRDASNLMLGRWHLIASYDQQGGGFPPNIRYFDYIKITGVSGDAVYLDRRIRHLHRDDLFERRSDPGSIGAARIIPLDVGGPRGLIPNMDIRLTIRQTFKDIEFVTNPSTNNESNKIIYIMDALDASFENCIMPHPVPSIVKHMRYVGGNLGSSEPDKLISTLIADNVRSGEVGGATGVELYLMRNSTSAPLQISPRQFRAINSIVDATNNRHLGYPISWAYNGPVLTVELRRTTLRVNPASGDPRAMPSIKSTVLALGTDASWNGDRLTISNASPVFLDWEVWLFEGMIVYTEAGSWGVVRRVSSPPDGSALWVDIKWMSGAKPITGALLAGRGHSLTIDAESKVEGKGSWDATSGGFMQQSLPPTLEAFSHSFPAGYPASEYGF